MVERSYRVFCFFCCSWTAITQLAHHGMLFVPIGYTFGPGMFKMDSIRGGSPYGAGVFAGDGTREPSETELALAEHQGKYMAVIVKRLAESWWYFAWFHPLFLLILLIYVSDLFCLSKIGFGILPMYQFLCSSLFCIVVKGINVNSSL